MSASTAAAAAASPAANNAASLTMDSNSRPNPRRRLLAAAEKRSSIELGSGGGINGVVDANGKDPSRSTREEAALERSKDASQLKKGYIASSTISPRRRKHAPKPEKPWWATTLSVLTKNCLLLVVILWVGQLVWRWADGVRYGTSSPFMPLDYEGRIWEVEASLKKMAKMLQVQLEVVDKKIGNEIAVVKKELQQVDERGNLLDKEIKSLGGRADHLDKYLGELKDTGFLSKAEFETLWNELKKSGKLDSGDKDTDLDHIRALAREIVEKEIEKHAADGLGRVDYALGSGGARVVRHSEPHIFGKSTGWFPASKSRNAVHANAQKMLEPSFGEPGQCFPLQGSAGFVEIKLRTGIIPEAITLEHVAKSVAYDRSSAPKDCRVSAWFEAPEDDPSNRAEKKSFLTEFSYDLEKSNVQTFSGEAASVVNMVRLDFTSNHGSSALTCLYRLRVHGYEPGSAAAMARQDGE